MFPSHDRGGQYQPISNFHKKKSRKDNLAYECKKCNTKRVRIRYQTNKNYRERNNQNAKEWAKENRDKINETRRKRRASMSVKQKEKLKQQQKCWNKTYRNKNRDRLREKQAENRKTEKYKKMKREYYQNNELARMKNNVSLSVRNALKKQGAKKDYKTFQMLPYSPQDLKEHIENQFAGS